MQALPRGGWTSRKRHFGGGDSERKGKTEGGEKNRDRQKNTAENLPRKKKKGVRYGKRQNQKKLGANRTKCRFKMEGGERPCPHE